MSDPDLHDVVGEYLELAGLGQASPAVQLVLGLLDRGATTEAVIVDVLAADQREAGERWVRNEWTVADEHLASGVTQRALDAVASTTTTGPDAGSVVATCAEGDWHSLPAQMGAEVLRASGTAVSFLGASTPADHVSRLLERVSPDALVVTCNLPLFFNGVTRLAGAAHRAGVPVLAGGRAVPSLQRALALGADAWEPDIALVAPRIAGLACAPRLAPDRALTAPAAVLLDLQGPQLASLALDAMLGAHPFMRRFDEQQLRQTEEDLASMVRYVAAALVVGECTVLTEFLDWLQTLLNARGVPSTAIVAGLEALMPLITSVDPTAGELTRDAAYKFAG